MSIPLQLVLCAQSVYAKFSPRGLFVFCIFSLGNIGSPQKSPQRVNFTSIFGANTEQLLHRYYSIFLMAASFGKNEQKYGTHCKSWSLKYAVKFQQKCW